VIPGGSTLSEATSQDLARLVADVNDRGIKALIGNVQQQNRLLDAIADESGGTLQVVPIYVESIGEPGSPAADYQGMMIWNAQQMVQALQD
jgi:zinc/manganese transport system substrate-binding protein